MATKSGPPPRNTPLDCAKVIHNKEVALEKRVSPMSRPMSHRASPMSHRAGKKKKKHKSFFKMSISLNGKTFHARSSDGFINIGALFTRSKRWSNYRVTRVFQTDLADIQEATEIPSEQLTESTPRGTFVHPLLASRVAAWVDPHFNDRTIATRVHQGDLTILPEVTQRNGELNDVVHDTVITTMPRGIESLVRSVNATVASVMRHTSELRQALEEEVERRQELERELKREKNQRRKLGRKLMEKMIDSEEIKLHGAMLLSTKLRRKREQTEREMKRTLLMSEEEESLDSTCSMMQHHLKRLKTSKT